MDELNAPSPSDPSSRGPLRRALAERNIHVWTVRTEGPEDVVERFARVLSGDEKERAARFRFDYLQRSFVLGHGALRFLLGAYLGIPPAAVTFRYGSKGKPAIDLPGGVDFNLSHSGALAVIAFTASCEIGIDVEQIRALPEMRAISSLYFCSEEAEELMSLDERQRPLAFFLCWTRKEAYLKAIGDGLSAPLGAFRVSLAPSEPARFIHIERDANTTREWVLHDVQLEPNYAAAVAYRGPERRLELFPVIDAGDLLTDPLRESHPFALAMRSQGMADSKA